MIRRPTLGRSIANLKSKTESWNSRLSLAFETQNQGSEAQLDHENPRSPERPNKEPKTQVKTDLDHNDDMDPDKPTKTNPVSVSVDKKAFVISSPLIVRKNENKIKMAISLVSLSTTTTATITTRTPLLASLTLITSTRRNGVPSLNVTAKSHSCSGHLHCFFTPSSTSLTSTSSFAGLSLGVNFNNGIRQNKGGRFVVRAGKAALCLTKRNRSTKSLARTHGFRRRMRTTSGKAILRRRRAKGRKILCTKTSPHSGPRS
ncbi:hypothetical protein GIB67_030116 [Kingdonia uniflora]|uniref:Large ribosomal subunit protein bL34c n=1 Tax=Kingdonia uniflora TaxID=39325 RepID=A0A7J7L2H2_9MAGN|nr:hypothetical protein GIB67_030116 [Kingdonia uniflora]